MDQVLVVGVVVDVLSYLILGPGRCVVVQVVENLAG
jgi:hypothetical protein